MSDHPDHSATLDDILRRRRRRTIRIVAVVLLLAAAVAAGWYLLRPAAPPPPPPMPEPPAPAARPEPVVPAPPPAPPAPEPAARAPEPEPLPPLDESDPLAREVATSLSSRPELDAWLAPSELIRRGVASVDNVAEGKSPRDQLRPMWPREKFTVVTDGETIRPDPASYARYDALTDVFVSIDSRALVRAYRQVQPLIDEAYRDLGYPERSFDDALRGAIAELLAAPVVVGEPLLEPRVISYAYADPDLEGLSAAQKQLLRLGPSNAPRVQRKLREIARALGIPENALPLTPIHQVERAP
jgi:hypothetical protein